MAYWWVSQNQTFREEFEGGYLWAPAFDKAGRTPHHWRNMLYVQPGDVIFSSYRGTIAAVGMAVTTASKSDRPSEFRDQALWKREGYKIDVIYSSVEPPLSTVPLRTRLLQLIPSQYSPLTKTGAGNQGYLFALPDAAGEYLLSETGRTSSIGDADELLERVLLRAPLDTTEKMAITKSRIGQGRFRQDLISYWDGACAVTGAKVPQLLRASHIKPWASSDNAERLDVFNGLLLTAHYDAAFDANLISFDDTGMIVISPEASKEQLAYAGINFSAKLRHIASQHQGYLKGHRCRCGLSQNLITGGEPGFAPVETGLWREA